MPEAHIPANERVRMCPQCAAENHPIVARCWKCEESLAGVAVTLYVAQSPILSSIPVLTCADLFPAGKW